MSESRRMYMYIYNNMCIYIYSLQSHVRVMFLESHACHSSCHSHLVHRDSVCMYTLYMYIYSHIYIYLYSFQNHVRVMSESRRMYMYIYNNICIYIYFHYKVMWESCFYSMCRDSVYIYTLYMYIYTYIYILIFIPKSRQGHVRVTTHVYVYI